MGSSQSILNFSAWILSGTTKDCEEMKQRSEMTISTYENSNECWDKTEIWISSLQIIFLYSNASI